MSEVLVERHGTLEMEQLIERFSFPAGELIDAVADCMSMITPEAGVSMSIQEIVPAGDDLPGPFHAPCILATGRLGNHRTLLLFRLPDVLVYVGHMLGLSSAEIEARLAGGYSDDDRDAFGEAMNQVFGHLGTRACALLAAELECMLDEARLVELTDAAGRAAILTPGGWMLTVLSFRLAGSEPSLALALWPRPLVEALCERRDAGGDGSAVVPPGNRRPLSKGEKLARALAVKVAVTVVLAQKKMSLGEILALNQGSIIQFDKSSEEFLDLCAGHNKVAEGEAAKIGERFCIQVKKIQRPAEILRAL